MKGRRLCSYPVQCYNYKGAVIMIWISMALYFYWTIVPGDIFSIIDATYNKPSLLSLYLILILQIFYPLFGWIADAWIGRYKAILIGLYLLIIGCVFLTFYTIIKYFDQFVSCLFLYTSIAITSLGIAAVNANILPFITDQMIGASANELSATVHWWYWSQNFPSMIAYDEFCILQDSTQILTSIFLSFSGLAIALSSIFLCQHWLNKTPQITNPIKHIAKVLNYARKNKYPRNRSALTYWEQDVPLRLDLGKDKYGGPFSEEEVENVKTTLRLIPVILICAMIGIVVHVRTFQQIHMTVNNDDAVQCLFRDELSIVFHMITFGIPLYHLLIRPLLHKMTKYTPSMLKLIGFAFFIEITGSVGMVTIETIGHLQTPNVTCMIHKTINKDITLNFYWTMIPLVFKGLGIVVFDLVINEFIIAQSPQQMKGFLFGLYYAFNGVAKIIGYKLDYPFKLLPQSIPVSCGFYYYLTQTILLSLVFIIFLILSKRYKLRVRNNPVNIHMIAETHITAYIEQEEENNREMDEENYSIHSSNQDIFKYYGAINYET